MPVIGTLFAFVVGAIVILGGGLMAFHNLSFYAWRRIIAIAMGGELVALALSDGKETLQIQEQVILSISIVALPWVVSAWFIWVMFRFFNYPNSHHLVTFIGAPFFYISSLYVFGGASMYLLGF